MLNPQLKERISQAYAKLGDIGFDISLNLRKGKDFTHKQQELWTQGILLRLYLHRLVADIAFLEDGTVIVYQATEKQVNRWIDVLIKVGELDKYPIVPTIFPSFKPIKVNKGEKGDQGNPGTNGSDANIVVQPEIGDTSLFVREEIIGGVKHYFLSFNPYSDPQLLVSIQGSKVFEVGTTQNFNIAITTTKGKNNITALTVLNPSALNADLQPLVNLPTLNGGVQPVVTSLPVSGVTVTTTYQIRVTDGTTSIEKTDQAVFVYPFLYGDNGLTSFDRYTLAKLIATKGTRQFTLDGVNTYFYIAYPVEYGDLQSIKDQNGFDVTTSWQVATEDVTSNSLPANWTHSYKVYRTIEKTTINNRIFTIAFP